MTVSETDVKLQLEGVTIAMYKADPEYDSDGATPDDIFIYIDTTNTLKGKLCIRINDALVYFANPELPEDISHTQLDGYFVVNK